MAQRAIGASEASLDHVDLTAPHTYALRWEVRGATFAVDGETVLSARTAPAGSLAFVAWIDNGYAVATPQGCFGLGLVAEPGSQWLDIEELRIETDSPAPRASG